MHGFCVCLINHGLLSIIHVKHAIKIQVLINSFHSPYYALAKRHTCLLKRNRQMRDKCYNMPSDVNDCKIEWRELGWCSYGRTRLAQTWPSLESFINATRGLSVLFVFSPALFLSFFSPVSHSSQKLIAKFQFNLERVFSYIGVLGGQQIYHFPEPSRVTHYQQCLLV